MPRLLVRMALVGAVTTVGSFPSAAQRPSSLRAGLSQPSAAARTSQPVIVDSIPQSHWATGMFIGGVVGGALGVLALKVGRGSSDVNRGGSVTVLIAVALGAVIGGLIASGSHKGGGG